MVHKAIRKRKRKSARKLIFDKLKESLNTQDNIYDNIKVRGGELPMPLSRALRDKTMGKPVGDTTVIAGTTAQENLSEPVIHAANKYSNKSVKIERSFD